MSSASDDRNETDSLSFSRKRYEEEVDNCRLKIAWHPEVVRVPPSRRASVGKAKGMLKKHLKNAPVLPLEDMDELIEKSVYEANVEALHNEGS